MDARVDTSEELSVAVAITTEQIADPYILHLFAHAIRRKLVDESKIVVSNQTRQYFSGDCAARTRYSDYPFVHFILLIGSNLLRDGSIVKRIERLAEIVPFRFDASRTVHRQVASTHSIGPILAASPFAVSSRLAR